MKPKSSLRNGAPGRESRKEGPSQRQLRVGEEIRHALAEIFLRTEFHEKALAKAHLTISEVRMSPDLKHATVFTTALGGKDITPLLPALKRVSPFLRAQIAPKLGLRVTPDLKFLADEALEEATRINKLLHQPEVARDLETGAKPPAAAPDEE
ncbi:30S ribosome-binding factor RbfA [Acidocella sp.]|uniref:30S ribosome-binding factor RbfA n=1 Tax=Acidocella sp. TaxID=50710 RepID=UPI0017CCA533|nr:30S ribosome-binding factor RbfA [Acidocella sp.]NNM55766.1 30S ribosome-binding factor RbfA [Acidocella sp.]